MITDQELAKAVEGRPDWRPAGEDSAVYSPPGQPASVRVFRIRRPTRHDRYQAAVIEGGQAKYAAPFGFAAEAVRWAERVKLS